MLEGQPKESGNKSKSDFPGTNPSHESCDGSVCKCALPGCEGHPMLSREHDRIMKKLLELYADLFLHDGFGNISIEMKFLKKSQKEIIISSGKDYRFVVDWPEPAEKV
jgi:hypothetical protein